MSLTNWLLLIIIAILIRQFYPGTADAIVGLAVVGGAIYGGYWLVARYPDKRRKDRAARQQEEADEREYWEYQKKHDAIRDKYDPHREWNEATSVPREYLSEIRNLNLLHQAMLIRRNGWTPGDFAED